MRAIRSMLILTILAACSPPAGEKPDSTPAPDGQQTTPVEGVVRVVGSAPMDLHVVVETADRSSLRIAGPLRGELQRLSGARVALEGRVEDSRHPVTRRELHVTGYRILSVNGEPVVSGIVEGTSGGWTVLRTPEGDRVYLASAPDDLERGQKVWVQGPRGLIVQSYGVLRP